MCHNGRSQEMKLCADCGQQFPTPPKSQRRFCDSCKKRKRRESDAKYALKPEKLAQSTYSKTTEEFVLSTATEKHGEKLPYWLRADSTRRTILEVEKFPPRPSKKIIP